VPDKTEQKAIAKVAKLILDYSDSPTINMGDASTDQAVLFFMQVTRAFILLDQMAPQFIELVEEYHSKPFGPREDCHLCKLREAAEEYLAEWEKFNAAS